MGPRYSKFVIDELLPFCLINGSNPSRLIAGISSGAIAAFGVVETCSSIFGSSVVLAPLFRFEAVTNIPH